MNTKELTKYKKTLKEIAVLEEKYNMLGVSVLTERGSKITLQEMADYVLSICKQTVEIQAQQGVVSIKDWLGSPCTEILTDIYCEGKSKCLGEYVKVPLKCKIECNNCGHSHTRYTANAPIST